MAVYGVFQPAPLFPLAAVVNEEGITEIRIAPAPDDFPEPEWLRDDAHPIIREAKRQVEAYFGGELRTFQLPLAPRGTPFHQRVWKALLGIPYGEIRSYGEIAVEVGSVARAVGQANGANPIAIVIPCHRVLQSGGALGGYAAGLERKAYLLELERAIASGIRVRRPVAERPLFFRQSTTGGGAI